MMSMSPRFDYDMVDTLIEALETERHARGPLLLTVLDELARLRLEAAVKYAGRLLDGLGEGTLGDAEFSRSVSELRSLVTASSR